MKILTTAGLTELIRKIKSTFIAKTDVTQASTIDVDSAPSSGSNNLVSSGGVYSAISDKYTKPSTGIPKTDLASSVQSSLDKADSALQTAPVTSVSGRTGDITLSGSDVGLDKVGNFKAVSTEASQGLTSTEKSNARANIGAKLTAFAITEDMVTVTQDATKGVAPYSTSYGYTNITISDDAGVEWVEGGIYTFIVNTKMVVASAYRNVRVRIGETGDWKPCMGTSSAATGSSYFVKSMNTVWQYKSVYQTDGALHVQTDNNTTYAYLVNSIAAGAVKIDDNGYASRFSLIFPTTPVSNRDERWSGLMSTYNAKTTKTAVVPSSGKFYIDRHTQYISSANVSAGQVTENATYQDYTTTDIRYSCNTSADYVSILSKLFLYLKDFDVSDMSFTADDSVGAIMSIDKIPTKFPSSITNDVYLYFLGTNNTTWYSLAPNFTQNERFYKYTPSTGVLTTFDPYSSRKVDKNGDSMSGDLEFTGGSGGEHTDISCGSVKVTETNNKEIELKGNSINFKNPATQEASSISFIESGSESLHQISFPSDSGTVALTKNIPSKTSDLTNDSNFITSAYHDETKQDVLIAGNNIQIVESQRSGDNIFNERLKGGIYNTSNGAFTPSATRVCSESHIIVSPNTTYTFSVTPDNSSIISALRVIAYDSNKNYIKYIGTSSVFTTPANCTYITFYIALDFTPESYLATYKTMINVGSSALPYVPAGEMIKETTISAIVPTKTSELTNDSGFISNSYHDDTKQNSIVFYILGAND